jgi:hypothetical protein
VGLIAFRGGQAQSILVPVKCSRNGYARMNPSPFELSSAQRMCGAASLGRKVEVRSLRHPWYRDTHTSSPVVFRPPDALGEKVFALAHREPQTVDEPAPRGVYW